ncbi:MAG: extracellular solute-binding protein [Rhodobacteraceae bacterium]|nr:extracellular solute-binding protein [Paracoccaceae bacterium]
MAEPVILRGITWDHSRGFDPMVATAAAFSALCPEVLIKWEKRSLQAFADRPIQDMAREYDLMVIDHPHVGEVAKTGVLQALDSKNRAAMLADLARQSVGPSHETYNIDGRQWALAIDAATPVACYRPDVMQNPPKCWDDVIKLAQQGKVAFALKPINALMIFLGLARNLDADIAVSPEVLIDSATGTQVLEALCEIAVLMDSRCLNMDPIDIFEWMGRQEIAPSYAPFGYGYTNYSRDGYCQYPLVFADAPGFGDNGPRGTVIGGTGIAVSAQSKHKDIAEDYAFWIASAECQAGLFFEAGGQPANAVAWDSAACNGASREFFSNTRATLESSWVRPRYDGYMGFQAVGGDIIHDCLCGKASIAQTLAKLQNAYLRSRT